MSKGDGGSAGSTGEGGAPPPGSAANTSVLQHHNSATRDGVYFDPTMTRAYAASLRLNAAFAPVITGNVYAQPLYVTQGPAGKPAFIVATESNHVMAIDDGGRTLWETTEAALGPPVTGVRTALGCGNIDPLGVTGTPIIDVASRRIYLDAMAMVGGVPKHRVYALLLDTGAVVAGWPIDMDAAVPGFVSRVQNQRGALALVGDILYVPYGGQDGDCGPYHGWVVGVSTSAPSSVSAFSTGTLGAGTASKGGIWAVGGAASDGTSLFVSTGNTTGATEWSGGEAVLRLQAGPMLPAGDANEFHPASWAAYDQGDVDLGGANPVVFDLPQPNGAAQRLVVALGKDGIVYILNRDNLGGTVPLSTTTVAPNGGAEGALNAAAAVYTTRLGTYVAYRINKGPGINCPSGGQSATMGVAKIAGTPPTATVVWCSSETGIGSPMVTTTGGGDVLVWNANVRLYGYDGDTGAKVFAGGAASDGMPSAMHYFNTPIDVGGRVVVATSGPGHLCMFSP